MSLYVIPEPPLPQTVRVVRELTGRVLVWQPRRWVPDAPARIPDPPEVNPAEVRDEGVSV